LLNYENISPLTLLNWGYEIASIQTAWESGRRLGKWLIDGTYPEVVLRHSIKDKESRITEIKNSWLIKDILEFQILKHTHMELGLLKLLVFFQIGSEVSTAESGRQIGRFMDAIRQGPLDPDEK